MKRTLVIITLSIMMISSCKKETAKLSIDITNTFFKVVEVDIDNKENADVIFRTKQNVALNSGGGNNHNEPLGWRNWTFNYRHWWCDQNVNKNNPFYCLVCSDCNGCKPTPVTWVSRGITQEGLLYWEVATEVSVDHYRIEYSKDGTKFITLVDNIKPKGAGRYEYHLK